MELHNLKPAERATAGSKRIGRGQGSGKGGTSTKGHKGAQSRSGYSRKNGFEGGQMPIYRLLPKRGFKNINRVEYNAINLSTLQKLADDFKLKEVTLDTLIQHGLAKKKSLIKILGNGELTAKMSVSVHAFSKTAIVAIENAGGKALVIGASVEEESAKKTTKTAKKEEVVETPEVPAEKANEEIDAQ
jgi:large subunit ribosomal protein L15